jgi:diaminopimelate decarboxylase
MIGIVGITRISDKLDTAIAAMTSEQMQELNACLGQLAKKLIPRLPPAFQREHKKQIDEIRAVSRFGNGQSELRQKASALDWLTRIVSQHGSGLSPDDPMIPIFMRSMEALCQLGLATRREIDMASEEGEALRQLYALQEAQAASETSN